MTEPALSQTNSPIVAAYIERTPTSAQLFQRAQASLPSGLTHDARHIDPYPIYVERAQGSRKWDVDGHEYVDYMGGHGALLLGHNHPEVTAVAKRQLDIGTHFGACHELEIRWAELIKEMIPSAEKVRFTSSGTEATLLALRMSRGSTGKTKVIRYACHFHGWHDHFSAAYVNHFDGSAPIGVLNSVADDMIVVPPNDLDATRVAIEGGDIAAVILEPTGASWGHVPAPPEFVAGLRKLTAKHDVILIFDEVISGFRCSPGGAQAALGITPDLTTLAKIMAGGLPGGAVVGRTDLIDLISFDEDARGGHEKILHFGTFNGNPESAATGIACLEIVKNTDACAHANRAAAKLRAGLTEVVIDEKLPWGIYGTFSGFHIFTNPEKRKIDPVGFDPLAVPWQELRAGDPPIANKLRLGMLVYGVDINGWPGGMTSAVSSDDDFDQTIDAFKRTIRDMKDEGDL
jgi:glutamate-1-semialdehyde 2,1-aminomutase